MNILPNIKIIDLALYLEKEKTLVIGDLHLGYEEMLNKKGILVPRFQYEKIIEHLDLIFAKCAVQKIIIAGDLKHEFGTISDQEWKEVLNFLDYLSRYTKNIILIKGNHDTIIGPLASYTSQSFDKENQRFSLSQNSLNFEDRRSNGIASKKNIKIYDNYYFEKKKIYITHGHKIPDDLNFSDSKIVIIGHEHPAISLRDETRAEKIKCFLKGKFQNKKLIVIPSFNFLTEGTDIISEGVLSPFLKQELDDFEVYAVEKKEVLYFGMLKNLSD